MGVGSARSLNEIDIGKIIFEAKENNILISGGGHKMAAGFKISIDLFAKFEEFLLKISSNLDYLFIKKTFLYDIDLLSEELNLNIINIIEKLEPYGKGNPEPLFLLKDIKILFSKIIKDKHIMITSKNNYNDKIQGFCFNCVGSILGENLINSKSKVFDFICNIKRNNYNTLNQTQLIIHDAFLKN